MNILSLCDKTGNMVAPWLEAGHDCTIVDLQHPAGEHREGRLTRIGADVLAWQLRGSFDVAFAFPPCTDLAGSGARWWAAKGPEALARALAVVRRCWELMERSGAPVRMLENPVGRLSANWRKPDHTFHPCEFGGYLTPPGDAYTKRTCLWTSAAFVMPERRSVPPVEGSKMHLVPPGPERANIRSATPMGFARAVFLANQERRQASLFAEVA